MPYQSLDDITIHFKNERIISNAMQGGGARPLRSKHYATLSDVDAHRYRENAKFEVMYVGCMRLAGWLGEGES